MAADDRDDTYIRLKRMTLDYVKRSGGRRMSASELRESAAVEGFERAEGFEASIERLLDLGLLGRAGDGGGGTGERIAGSNRAGAVGTQPSAGGAETVVGGAGAEPTGRAAVHRPDSASPPSVDDRFRELLVPEIVPEDDDDLDEDSGALKEYQRQWDRILSEKNIDKLPDWIIEAYTSQMQELARRSSQSTLKHIGTYVSVNAGLIAVWAFSGMGFPWPVFPAFGWLIGLGSDIGSTIRRRKHAEELNDNRRPTIRQLVLLRQLRNLRERHESTLILNPVIAVSLAAFNLVSSPFPWAVIPGIFLAGGAISAARKLRRKGSELKAKLADSGFRLPDKAQRRQRRKLFRRETRERPEPSSDLAPVAMAQQYAELIRSQLERLGDDAAGAAEVQPVVDECVEAIRALARKDEEISAFVREIPWSELERDAESLRSRLSECDDDRLRAEYERSIEQIERELESIRELQREREVISLRLQSTLGCLKQLRIDLARLERISGHADLNTASMVETRTREVSRYLHDLGEAHLGESGPGAAFPGRVNPGGVGPGETHPGGSDDDRPATTSR